MYNAHRGMVPAPLPNGRLTELLDQIRAEFEGQQNKSEDYERNSKFASTPSLFAQRFCNMHPPVSLLLFYILQQQSRYPLHHKKSHLVQQSPDLTG